MIRSYKGDMPIFQENLCSLLATVCHFRLNISSCTITRGTRCNLEKDCELKGCKVMGVLCLSAVKNMEKDRKLKDFHFSSICEGGEKKDRVAPEEN